MAAKPWRSVFSITTRGSRNCNRWSGPPAFEPTPERPRPPKGLAADDGAGDAPVDVDVAGAQLARRPPDGDGASGQDPRRQGVLGVVGQRQRLVETGGGEDAEHRPEDLLACQAPVR